MKAVSLIRGKARYCRNTQITSVDGDGGLKHAVTRRGASLHMDPQCMVTLAREESVRGVSTTADYTRTRGFVWNCEPA